MGYTVPPDPYLSEQRIRVTLSCDPLVGRGVMTGPGYQNWVAVAGRGHLRASHADREQTIDALKAAFVQGRLTKDELDARVGQTLASRTYAELAMVIAGLPAEPARPHPPRKPVRRPTSNAVRWVASGWVTPAVLAAAYVLASLRGGGGYEVVALVIASVYFIFWLSAGADLLWQWHCMSLPGVGMCVRCAHTAASHHAPTSCAVRLGSLKSRRCSCSGYVPPGRSPRTAERRVLSTR
jgi:Domain of unknown function (DUF1707)